MNKKKVLVMVDWYAPGFKAGGPIRSVVNFADQLENDLEIYVLTTDRDLGETQPYSDTITDQWIAFNNHKVYYTSPGNLSWSKLQKVISEINADYIYLNSMFSRFFSIYPLMMKRMGKLKSKIVLAPRGMLKDSALQYKAGKKKMFISLFSMLGIPKEIVFQATDDIEVKDILREFGKNSSLFKAGNLPGKQENFLPIVDKKPGELKIIFIGRIHPIKNLDFLLQALIGIQEKVELTIIATLEDEIYWENCKSIIQQLSSNILVKLIQDLPHEKIVSVIRQHHIFALPTKGENFGHAIFEALAAGRPVLISDQTPWRNLEQDKAGWDTSIVDTETFRQSITKVAAWNLEQINEWCLGAWKHAGKYLNNSALKQSYLKQFS